MTQRMGELDLGLALALSQNYTRLDVLEGERVMTQRMGELDLGLALALSQDYTRLDVLEGERDEAWLDELLSRESCIDLTESEVNDNLDYSFSTELLTPLQTEAPPIYHVTHDYYELHDPTPSIHQLFTQFDQLFFYSKLGSVSVEWSNKMTSCAGVTYYKPDSHFCFIRLSRPILSLRPRKDLVETLLHEMIHSFLFVAQNNRDHTDHGPHFRSHQTRINTLSNCNITIYHSFHDEVTSLKKHWWRCVGKCRYKHPYYGFVKRAVCRPPSKSDPWWGTHLLTCGGEFEKIRSPDKPVKSVNKTTTTTTTTTPKKQVDDKQGKLNFKPIKLEDSYLDLNCEYFTPPNSPIVISSPDSETRTDTKQLTEAVTPKQPMKLKQCYFCAGFFEMALFENHFTNCISYFP